MSNYVMSAKAGRYWSLIGTLLVLGLTSVFLLKVDFQTIVQEFGALMSGNLAGVVKGATENLLEVGKSIVGVALVEILISLALALAVWKILGNAENGLESLLRVPPGRHAVGFFLAAFGEELFARFLFLGLLTKVFTGVTAFYVLMVIGNLIWAGYHLYNYRRESDRSFLRVLPQFVAGFFYAYLYVKYGLLVTAIAHFTSNAILFAIAKQYEVTRKEIYGAIYDTVLAIISYFVIRAMGQSVLDVGPWFTMTNPAPLAGFGFWQYFVIYTFWNAVFGAAVGWLFYDPNRKISEKYKSGLLMTIMAMPVFYGFVYLLNWFMGLFIVSLTPRVLFIVLLFVFLTETDNLSAMARSWFSGLVTLYIFLCLMVTGGFWLSMGVALLHYLIAALLPKACFDREE